MELRGLGVTFLDYLDWDGVGELGVTFLDSLLAKKERNRTNCSLPDLALFPLQFSGPI